MHRTASVSPSKPRRPRNLYGSVIITEKPLLRGGLVEKAVDPFEELRGLVRVEVGLGGADRLLGVAPAHDRGTHSGGLGGLDVALVVAGVERLFGLEAELLGRREEAVGVGLHGRTLGVRADHDVEEVDDAELGEHVLGEAFVFVGHHAELEAPGLEPVEHLGHARVDGRELGRVDRVEVEELLLELRIVGVFGRDAEGLSDQPGSALAREGFERLRVEGFEVVERAHLVDRGGEVRSGVDERAVEVEEKESGNHAHYFQWK